MFGLIRERRLINANERMRHLQLQLDREEAALNQANHKIADLERQVVDLSNKLKRAEDALREARTGFKPASPKALPKEGELPKPKTRRRRQTTRKK